MKTIQAIQRVVIEISPLASNVTDEVGNGIIGFTTTYTDGTFTNITRSFCPETRVAVQSEINAIKQLMENSLAGSQAAKPHNIVNQSKRNYRKRRLL